MDDLDRTVVVKSISTSSGKVCHLREMLYLPETTAKVREISTMYMGRKLLFDVEEDDYLYWERCNLPESQTELCGQVVLVKINTRRHISAKVLAILDRINSCFGFQGYQPVVVIDDPPMHRKDGQVAHRPASAPRNGTIIATGRYPLWEPCLWLPSGAIWVNSNDDDGMAMADAMSSVLRKNEEEKQLRHEKHYRYVSTHDVGYWARCFQQDLERACTYPPPVGKDMVYKEDDHTIPVLEEESI
jgi:trehalose 6-phosphate synthase/phosphatase